ncbi:hypothetical protein C8R46DRAFT_1211122 [Mycena filopes]|nr:hypothetical protein C8R46DRAFT_1211122 [Mycena filopes]
MPPARPAAGMRTPFLYGFPRAPDIPGLASTMDSSTKKDSATATAISATDHRKLPTPATTNSTLEDDSTLLALNTRVTLGFPRPSCRQRSRGAAASSAIGSASAKSEREREEYVRIRAVTRIPRLCGGYVKMRSLSPAAPPAFQPSAGKLGQDEDNKQRHQSHAHAVKEEVPEQQQIDADPDVADDSLDDGRGVLSAGCGACGEVLRVWIGEVKNSAHGLTRPNRYDPPARAVVVPCTLCESVLVARQRAGLQSVAVPRAPAALDAEHYPPASQGAGRNASVPGAVREVEGEEEDGLAVDADADGQKEAGLRRCEQGERACRSLVNADRGGTKGHPVVPPRRTLFSPFGDTLKAANTSEAWRSTSDPYIEHI